MYRPQVRNLILKAALALSICLFACCSAFAQGYAQVPRIWEQAVVIGQERPLRGALSMPAGSEMVPCVVLVQGLGAKDMNASVGPNKPFMQLAAGLARRGVAVLRLDSRVYAYPGCQNHPNFDINEEMLMDASDAIDFVRSHPRIDSQRVFYCGHSLAGVLAPEMARRVPDLAGIVILSSPGRSLDTVVGEFHHNLKAISIGLFAPRCWQQVKDIDAPREVAQLSKPVFVAQGVGDQMVPLVLNLKHWQDTTARRNVHLAVYNMNHSLLQLPNDCSSLCCNAIVSPQLLNDLTGWVHGARPEIASR